MADQTSTATPAGTIPDSIDDILDAQDGKAAPAKGQEAEGGNIEDILDEEDEDEFGAFDVPTEKLPKPEEKKEEAKATPEPEKKAESKSKEGDEAPKPTISDSSKTPSEKSEEKKDEKPPSPSSLVKVKIGDKEHEIPEEVANHWEKVAARAKEIQDNTLKLHENLFSGFGEKPVPGQFSATALDLLTENMGGNREKAYESLLKEYAAVLKREIDFRSQPEDTQKRILAEEKAARLEAELKTRRDTEARAEKEKREAEFLNRCASSILGSMKELGIGITTENRAIYDRALSDLVNVAHQKKGLTRMDVAAIVKNAKGESDSELQKREAESKRRVEQLAALSDEEFEKEAERHKALIDRLRKWDTAKLKEERAAKKAEAPKAEPEPKRSPAQKPRKTLNTAEWDATFK